MNSNIVESFREYIISRINCYKMTKANLPVRAELANACEHLKELIKNNDWISVDVSLPHPIDLNIDCRNHRNRLQVYYTDVYGVEMVDYAWFVYNSEIEDVGFELCTTGGIVQPTHWQPLPNPPKE